MHDDDPSPLDPLDALVSAASVWAELGVHPSEVLGEEMILDDALHSMRWARLPDEELVWRTFEVLDDVLTDEAHHRRAERWWDVVGDSIQASAFQFGAQETDVHHFSWGVVFEVAFLSDAQADGFIAGPAMVSAFEQLDTLRLIVSAGRGGGAAGVRSRRGPRPILSSGAAEVPLPEPDPDPVFTSHPARFVVV